MKIILIFRICHSSVINVRLIGIPHSIPEILIIYIYIDNIGIKEIFIQEVNIMFVHTTKNFKSCEMSPKDSGKTSVRIGS